MLSSQSSESKPPVKALNTRSILDAAEDGCPLSPAEALHLLALSRDEDLNRLRQVADVVRQRQAAEPVGYEVGASLFLTNLCEMAPALYPYPRQLGEVGAYTLTIDDIDATLELARSRQARQLGLSGGGFCENLQIPGLDAPNLLKTWARVLSHIWEQYPELSVQGFSPDEIEFLSVVNNRDERYILELLMDHGLTTLDSYGTEVLVDSVRSRISPKKATVKRWLDIVAMAGALGLPVLARAELGPMETLAERVRHLSVLKGFLEKHPSGLLRLVPQMWRKLPVAAIPTPGMSLLQARDRFKFSAVSRLFLGHLLPEQTVFWLPDREGEAQEALSWGANHFGRTDGLAYHHFLTGEAGGMSNPKASLTHSQGYTGAEFSSLIQETGASLRQDEAGCQSANAPV